VKVLTREGVEQSMPIYSEVDSALFALTQICDMHTEFSAGLCPLKRRARKTKTLLNLCAYLCVDTHLFFFNFLFSPVVLSLSPADIRTAVDDFYDPSTDAGGRQIQVTYECLSLLCGAVGGGAGDCGGGVVGGGRFAESEAFVERLCFRLEQDRAQQRRVRHIIPLASVPSACVPLCHLHHGGSTLLSPLFFCFFFMGVLVVGLISWPPSPRLENSSGFAPS